MSISIKDQLLGCSAAQSVTGSRLNFDRSSLQECVPWRAPAFMIALFTVLIVSSHSAVADDPPIPPGKDPGGVAVALVDTGVNYTLPEIANRLARAAGGDILGFDFQDSDRLPFDLEPGAGAAAPRRHGTLVASILIREAPQIRLIPYRFAAKRFETFAAIVSEIAAGPARIVAMPLGGYRRQDWLAFREAANAHPEVLFILSAGNDGRNIDERPVYPASFEIKNALIVTSTNSFGRLPPESNWGTKHVDFSTPGERIKAFDHDGIQTRVSGSSFAVPRIAALAARLKARNPEFNAVQLKEAMIENTAPSPASRIPRTKYGWLPNPALIAAD